MVIAAVGSNLYDVVLLLHLLSIVLGLGPLTVNGLYTAKALRLGGKEGAAVSTANFEVSRLCQWAVYTIPIWGIGLVLGSKESVPHHASKLLYGFDKPWVGSSLLIWIVIVGLFHGMVVPSQRRLGAKVGELSGPPAPGGPAGSEGPEESAGPSGGGAASAEISSLDQRLALAGALIDVLLVVAFYLMIFKPGQ